MFAARLFPIAFTLVISGAALAQESATPAPAPEPAPPAAATAPHDCARQMARHDHGAEKGTPTPMMTGCVMAAPAASEAVPKAKAKLGHDHARFHKLM